MQRYHDGKENNDGCDVRMLDEDECATKINMCPIEYDDGCVHSEKNRNKTMDSTEILVNVEVDPGCIVQEYAESIWNDSRNAALENITTRQEVLLF